MTRVIIVAALALGLVAPAHADSEAIRICTVKDGKRSCVSGVVPVQQDRIMGMPADKYERGVKAGKCMPSPAGPGVCGGG